ncbi:cache domain-containing protein [bacterium]|nr:cache domain-containing protein [bacterium]
MRNTIGTRLTIGFGVAALMLVGLTLYTWSVSRQSLESSVGNQSVFLADSLMHSFDQKIHRMIEEIQKEVDREIYQQTLVESNRAFARQVNRDEGDGQKTAASRQKRINKNLTDHLSKMFLEYPEKQYGYSQYSNIVVTNRYGIVIAQTDDNTTDRLGNETGWKEAAKKGTYVGRVINHPEHNHGVFPIVVRIDDDEGNMLGLIGVMVVTQDFFREVELFVKPYRSTRIHLMTREGRQLYSTQTFKFWADLSGTKKYRKINGEKGFFIAPKGDRNCLPSPTRWGLRISRTTTGS